MATKNRTSIILALVFTVCGQIIAQTVQRPALWGIAKMTFLVSDFAVARDYYGRFQPCGVHGGALRKVVNKTIERHCYGKI